MDVIQNGQERTIGSKDLSQIFNPEYGLSCLWLDFVYRYQFGFHDILLALLKQNLSEVFKS